MTWIELLWFFPLGISISLVLGAVGRREPRDILVASAHTFWTLLCVVGGVAIVIRLLVVFFAS